MVEITYTINGIESSRIVRAAGIAEAIAIFREEYGAEFCIIRTTGPWAVQV